MEELDKLPIAEIRDTFWFQEFWLNGKLVERRNLLQIWKRDLSSFLNSLFMRAKGRAGFYLLRSFGENCPHCNKLIDVGRWKNPFDTEAKP